MQAESVNKVIESWFFEDELSSSSDMESDSPANTNQAKAQCVSTHSKNEVPNMERTNNSSFNALKNSLFITQSLNQSSRVPVVSEPVQNGPARDRSQSIFDALLSSQRNGMSFLSYFISKPERAKQRI